eukprot:3442825-Amphidinium_carterae.2
MPEPGSLVYSSNSSTTNCRAAAGMVEIFHIQSKCLPGSSHLALNNGTPTPGRLPIWQVNDALRLHSLTVDHILPLGLATPWAPCRRYGTAFPRSAACQGFATEQLLLLGVPVAPFLHRHLEKPSGQPRTGCLL